MSYSESYFDTTDIDWLTTNQDGIIAHFISGGAGYVPDSVKESYSDMESLVDHIYSLGSTSEVDFIEENIPQLINSEKKDKYLSPFIEMAARGLYCYDVLDVNGSDQGYMLIAFPKTPLQISSLPEELCKAANLPVLGEKGFDRKLYPDDWLLIG